jgi:hypothetical protein
MTITESVLYLHESIIKSDIYLHMTIIKSVLYLHDTVIQTIIYLHAAIIKNSMLLLICTSRRMSHWDGVLLEMSAYFIVSIGQSVNPVRQNISLIIICI